MASACLIQNKLGKDYRLHTGSRALERATQPAVLGLVGCRARTPVPSRWWQRAISERDIISRTCIAWFQGGAQHSASAESWPKGTGRAACQGSVVRIGREVQGARPQGVGSGNSGGAAKVSGAGSRGGRWGFGPRGPRVLGILN